MRTRLASRGDASAVSARLVRLGGMTALVSLSTVAVMVVLARTATVAEWSAIAIGQSVGAVGAIAVSMGWTVNGPSMVAPLGREERVAAYMDSLFVRLPAYLVVTPVAGVVAYVLAHAGGLLAVATAAATCLLGLSPRWFNLGTGAGRELMRYDILPIVVANVTTAVLLLAGSNPYCYPILVALAWIWGSARFTIVVAGRRGHRFRSRSGLIRRTLLEQRTVAASELLLTGFLASATALASAVLTLDQTAQFAADFRLLQFSLLSVYVLTQGTQGWIVETASSHRSRLRLVLGLHVGLGLLGGIALALLGPTASSILFGAPFQSDPRNAAWLGLAFFAISISTGVGTHVLVVFGKSKSRLRGAGVTVVTGVLAMAVLGSRGDGGAVAAVALGSLAGCLFQVAAAARIRQAP